LPYTYCHIKILIETSNRGFIMSAMPEAVKKAWADRQGPIVLTTIGNDGNPNNIYTSNVNLMDDDKIVLANKYIDRSMKNKLPDSIATLLFVTNDKKHYVVKGNVSYDYGGRHYKFMRTWSGDKHPGHGAAVVNINEIYEEGRKVI